MMDQRNFILAIVFSAAILFGYEYFFVSRAPAPAPEELIQGELILPLSQDVNRPVPIPGGASDQTAIPSVSGTSAGFQPEAVDRETALRASPRVRINSLRLNGSIALKGARIDDLTLIDYRRTKDTTSPEIVLLSPATPNSGYFGEFGWVASEDVSVPDSQTIWNADRETLTTERPVTLKWNNGAGLIFERTYSIDQDYMFTVTQRVINTSGAAVTLHPYGLVQRRSTPEVSGFFILHEGLVGFMGGSLVETSYSGIEDAVVRVNGLDTLGLEEYETTGGWMGITDKYWLAVLVPDQKEHLKARYKHWVVGNSSRYQADYLGTARTIASGSQQQVTNRLFAGAKEVQLLDRYQETLDIPEFWRAIDFGWFHFLTKPIFYALIYIHEVVGNFGIAILLLTVGVKLAFFPLANKSYRAMSNMKRLQPEMVKLRERYGDDKARLNQEMMALYKREGANPVSGCLPMVVQIPVFFSLYKVLFVTIEMRQAPFFGWIQDLSQADPTTIFNLFGLIPWSPPELIAHFGVWPLLMGATMFLQQRLNPQPADPVQAKIFLFMPLIFMILLASFPAGLVIYWAWNNILSIAQQWVIMRRMGVKI